MRILASDRYIVTVQHNDYTDQGQVTFGRRESPIDF
jgi:hypothetical protein